MAQPDDGQTAPDGAGREKMSNYEIMIDGDGRYCIVSWLSGHMRPIGGPNCRHDDLKSAMDEVKKLEESLRKTSQGPIYRR